MSKLYAFLNPEPIENKEVIVSPRFKDEEGNVVPFKIRALTQRDNNEISKRCSRSVKSPDGQMVKELDPIAYQMNIVLCGTVEPLFSSKEICDHFGSPDPLYAIENMLTAGEFAKLANEISNLSGFNNDAMAIEAKNSLTAETQKQ